MQVSSELLFFFSGLGAFNGFLLSFYFIFWAEPKSQSNKFLGAFLLMLSIRVLKSVFFYFIPDIDYSFLQLGLTGCFFIGPFLYFYFASVTNKKDTKLYWKEHLYVLSPIILLINILFPFETNIGLWRPFIIKGIYAVWSIYSIFASYQIRNLLPRIFNKINEEECNSIKCEKL